MSNYCYCLIRLEFPNLLIKHKTPTSFIADIWVKADQHLTYCQPALKLTGDWGGVPPNFQDMSLFLLLTPPHLVGPLSQEEVGGEEGVDACSLVLSANGRNRVHFLSFLFYCSYKNIYYNKLNKSHIGMALHICRIPRSLSI